MIQAADYANELVSVIVPVYNVAPYLPACLESIIRQTYRNLEVLVIDDGSTDDSGRICDEYQKKDARIKVFHQANSGLSAARNAGLDRASGAWLIFLDSDDFLEPEMVEVMLKNQKAHQADMVICGYRSERENHAVRICSAPEGEYTGYQAMLSAMSRGGIAASVWSRLYPSDMFHQIRFPEGRVYEDLSVLFRILSSCSRIYVTGQPLVYYRYREDSICHTTSMKHAQDCLTACQELVTFAEQQVKEDPENRLKNKANACLMRHGIQNWVRLAGVGDKDTQKYRQDLRKEIIRSVSKTAALNLRWKVAFALLVCCPPACQALFRAYHTITNRVWYRGCRNRF